jgi:hypothetical protein
MARVFVSYRRADSSRAAGEIVAVLERRRGLIGRRSVVFRDETSINPAEDWRQRLMNEVESCDWLVAVIGRHWLGAGADGQPRIHHRDDMVRIEVATALRSGIPVLPLTVDGARVPDIREVPRDIAMMTRQQGLQWPEDSGRLVATIKTHAKARRPPVPTSLLGTWVHAEPTLGATYEFSSDRTYSHMGVTEQHSPTEDYRFEIWEEDVATVDADRLVLQPFRAEATQFSSDGSRPSYEASPRELVD